MLFVPSLSDLDPELCNGLWSRDQLVEMDSRFTAAVAAAFSQGLESRAAASATVRIDRNGRNWCLFGHQFCRASETSPSKSEGGASRPPLEVVNALYGRYMR